MISRRMLLTALAAASGPAPVFAAAKPALPQVVTGTLYFEKGGCPWTPVTIAGRGPYRFLIDTGAHVSGMDETLGLTLGLKSLRKLEIGGVVGSREVDVFLATDVTIGNSFRQKEMALLGLGSTGVNNGLLAAGVLTFFDSEIDVVGGKFRLFPNGQTDRAGYSRVPGRFDSGEDGVSKRLYVQAMVDGHPANLLVDTGAATGVLLSTDFVQRNRMWAGKIRYVPTSGAGLSGGFGARLIRADVKFGDQVLKGSVVTMLDPSKPGGSMDGLVGMDVLRRFTFAFEARKPALWLKPNAALAEPFDYNRSGFDASSDREGKIKVLAVLPDSPAGRAGLAVGDLLPGLETWAAQQALDTALQGPAGGKVDFEVERDGKRRQVSLVLEELL